MKFEKYLQEQAVRCELEITGTNLAGAISGESQLPRTICDSEIASAAAGVLGKLGGKSKSPAKIAAVRKNGSKGGRPNLVCE